MKVHPGYDLSNHEVLFELLNVEDEQREDATCSKPCSDMIDDFQLTRKRGSSHMTYILRGDKWMNELIRSMS